jgi:hypothetical protein
MSASPWLWSDEHKRYYRWDITNGENPLSPVIVYRVRTFRNSLFIGNVVCIWDDWELSALPKQSADPKAKTIVQSHSTVSSHMSYDVKDQGLDGWKEKYSSSARTNAK